MNAAFAIGRLCDMDNGRKRLLQLSDSERMVFSFLPYFINLRFNRIKSNNNAY